MDSSGRGTSGRGTYAMLDRINQHAPSRFAICFKYITCIVLMNNMPFINERNVLIKSIYHSLLYLAKYKKIIN